MEAAETQESVGIVSSDEEVTEQMEPVEDLIPEAEEKHNDIHKFSHDKEQDKLFSDEKSRD